MTSSPGPMPSTRSASQVPSVPLATATACLRPSHRAKFFSKCWTIGPAERLV